jgi:hypothetical protein
MEHTDTLCVWAECRVVISAWTFPIDSFCLCSLHTVMSMKSVKKNVTSMANMGAQSVSDLFPWCRLVWSLSFLRVAASL